ncbi:hypothetical protein DMA11_20510 [Marinilabiliaceae bacterium JC017]|nr:hypothetical protein DMA11_20510 [Marinilabiliaceae bacterium JC017]
MSRKNSKKRKKISTPENNGTARKIYLGRLYELTKLTGCTEAFRLLTKQDQIDIYFCRVHYRKPRASEGNEIPTSIIKRLDNACHFFLNARLCKFPLSTSELLSVNELMPLVALSDFLEYYVTPKRKQELTQAFAPLLETQETFGTPIQNMYFYYNYIQLMLNRCDKTMYGFNTTFKSRRETTKGLYHELIIQNYPARSSQAWLNGKKRTVFQLGWPRVNENMSWQYLPVSCLGDLYKGTKKHLPICIQSHALKRFYDRVSIIDSRIANIHLDISFGRNDLFSIYQNNILLAYYYNSIKIGYFLANLVGNRVIIRTFLLVTHHYTPEGNKLEELSGLAKEDISYWKIDDLNTFLKNNLDDHPKIKALFEAAGIASLLEIRNVLNRDETTNSFNMHALVEYINRGNEHINNEVLEEQ